VNLLRFFLINEHFFTPIISFYPFMVFTITILPLSKIHFLLSSFTSCLVSSWALLFLFLSFPLHHLLLSFPSLFFLFIFSLVLIQHLMIIYASASFEVKHVIIPLMLLLFFCLLFCFFSFLFYLLNHQKS